MSTLEFALENMKKLIATGTRLIAHIEADKLIIPFNSPEVNDMMVDVINTLIGERPWRAVRSWRDIHILPLQFNNSENEQ